MFKVVRHGMQSPRSHKIVELWGHYSTLSSLPAAARSVFLAQTHSMPEFIEAVSQISARPENRAQKGGGGSSRGLPVMLVIRHLTRAALVYRCASLAVATASTY
jgi:hypothetical protein